MKDEKDDKEEFIIGLLFCLGLIGLIFFGIHLDRQDKQYEIQHLEKVKSERHLVQCYQNGVTYYDKIAEGEVIINRYGILRFQEQNGNYREMSINNCIVSSLPLDKSI